jgi:hypothetical protein
MGRTFQPNDERLKLDAIRGWHQIWVGAMNRAVGASGVGIGGPVVLNGTIKIPRQAEFL